jgi:SAM-dependent methyltransferase
MDKRILADPVYVKDQYRNSSNLDARIALHERFSTATRDFHEWVFDYLALPDRACVLEVGCGTGALWTKNRARVPATWELTLADFSLGMVETTRAAGITARCVQCDAQALPFGCEHFDAVIANHMLYHVPDLPRALAEIRRVLRPSGKLYAATNGEVHLREYFQLVADFLGTERHSPQMQFTLENGAPQLARAFAQVQRFDFDDALVVTETEPLVAYAMSGMLGKEMTGRENALRDFVAHRIAREGAMRITKAAGLFIAS